MILKVKRIGKSGKDAWEFIDEITNPTVDIGGISDNSIFINYRQKDGTFVDQMIDTETYLLNNDGKTIERIN